MRESMVCFDYNRTQICLGMLSEQCDVHTLRGLLHECLALDLCLSGGCYMSA